MKEDKKEKIGHTSERDNSKPSSNAIVLAVISTDEGTVAENPSSPADAAPSSQKIKEKCEI